MQSFFSKVVNIELQDMKAYIPLIYWLVLFFYTIWPSWLRFKKTGLSYSLWLENFQCKTLLKVKTVIAGLGKSQLHQALLS